MKAFLCREFGPISSHKVEEIDDLIPDSHDIVINVQGDEPIVPPPAIEMTRAALLSERDAFHAGRAFLLSASAGRRQGRAGPFHGLQRHPP